MQRIVGSVLILTATIGAGYMYGEELKQYLQRMLYLRYVIELIRGELTYTGAPIPELLYDVARRIREPYKRWLKSVAREAQERDETAFVRIWNRCVDRYLKELRLKTEHSILLKELGTFLGQGDRETLDCSVQLYLNRMDLEIEKLREGLASKKKIANCLGVMGGLFLVVLLL